MKTLSRIRNLGHLILFLCLSLFIAQFFIDGLNASFDLPGIFWVNYILSIAFFLIYLITARRLKKEQASERSSFKGQIYPIALVIFSISAHTLNYGAGLQVYAPYINWMAALVVLMHAAVLIHPYRESLPQLAQRILYFSYGIFILLSFYLLIFIMPLLLYAVPGAIFYGISLHSFVPLLFLFYFTRAIIQVSTEKWAERSLLYGFLIVFVVMGGFLFRWNQLQNKVETAIEIYKQDEGIGLPMWVVVSQHLPNDPMAEYIILSNFFTQKSFWEGGMNRLSSMGEFETRHDPLAFIAGTFLGRLDLSAQAAKEILESRYGARHQTHRRLWRGDKLETSQVKTEMEIHSDYRLAYVEKTLDIHYARKGERRWREQQEAVYSFHLPEGTVATSLSLWIDGKEEKSRLTTKGKADSAYVSIVGVERRDPALMHWQEGNRVTVTVFPCTPEEDRRFKIGFTMPIAYDEGKLSIENIYFDGPPTVGTKEIVNIKFVGSEPQELDLPNGLRKINAREYELAASYAPNWGIEWKAPELAKGTFAFQGKKYQISPLQKEFISWQPENIILDVNSSWKGFELAGIWDLVKDKKVYVFNPEQTELTEENHEAILQEMSELYFSLLPLDELPEASKSLIISAGTSHAPLLADLDKSAYAHEMTKFLSWKSMNHRWYNLGSEVSPYVETLNAFDLLDFERGNMQELEDLLAKGQFPIIQRDEYHIALQASQIQIKQELIGDSIANQNTAPDHLMRLFRYNELLQDIGRKFFDRKALEDRWIKKAEEAYVLSPVSSLIVLETVKDYERFGIEENENTLGNAKIGGSLSNANLGNSGAVPEPHEWLLILMVISLIIWKSRGRFL